MRRHARSSGSRHRGSTRQRRLRSSRSTGWRPSRSSRSRRRGCTSGRPTRQPATRYAAQGSNPGRAGRTSRPESQPDSQAETLVGTDYRPGLCSSATHAFDPWLGQELIRNSRDSEQGVGKRLQMAFINLAEKQLTDAEKALERRLAGEQRNARLEAERVRASEIKRRKMEMKQARQTTALRSASRI